jgi:ATP-dependent DNA helicase RecQ
MHIARQLLTMGLLKQEGEYHTLSLTSRALETLRKRESIFGVLQEAERVRKADKKKGEIEYNSALFALLRQKRKEMADELGVPPYVIFSDKALVEMAAYYPQSVGSLLKISGVGQVKLRQFGEAFLELIQLYCEKHGLQEKSKEALREKSSTGTNRRYVLVAEAYNSGETIQSLMERYGVTAGTVLEHLSRYLAMGNPIRTGEDLQRLTSVTPEQQRAAFDAFHDLSPTFLKPVYDKLNGTLNYDDLRVLRLMYLIAQSS